MSVSASAAIRLIVATASTGYWPMAVSPESITASVPSSTALKTSLASARVGRLEVSMLLSICVAVITGTRAWWQAAMICFWIAGTRGHVHLDAQVAARDHHGVGLGDDRVEVGHGLRLLDLGDDPRPAAPARPARCAAG